MLDYYSPLWFNEIIIGGYSMTNGVIYARYSCDKQTENSILGQVRECQEFARRNDINIINIYKDEAKSGRETAHRPDFLKMIKDASRRNFSSVIVWKGDRFSRSRADAARYKGELKKLGVTVLSATEANVTGPQAVLMDGINEAFAEYFSVELAAKVERGMTQNAIDGKYNGGVMVYGYKLNKDRKIVVNEPEAEVVREVFTRYAKEETSFAQILKDLYSRGLTRLKRNSMSTLLSNKKYIGIYDFKGVVNKTMYPPIIDEKIFYQVAEKLKRNKKIGARYSTPDIYLLTGKLFCGDCHHMMTSYAGTGRNNRRFKYYRCQGTKQKVRCETKYPKEFLEDVVFQECIDFINNDENIDMMVTQLEKYQSEEDPDLAATKQHLVDIDKKIARLNYAIAEGIDFESTIDQLKQYKDIREELKRKLDRIAESNKIQSPEMLRKLLKRLSTERYETIEGKKKIISILVDKVYAYKSGTVQVVFNVLNDGEPVIRESWCKSLSHSVHHMENYPSG